MSTTLFDSEDISLTRLSGGVGNGTFLELSVGSGHARIHEEESAAELGRELLIWGTGHAPIDADGLGRIFQILLLDLAKPGIGDALVAVRDVLGGAGSDTSAAEERAAFYRAMAARYIGHLATWKETNDGR